MDTSNSELSVESSSTPSQGLRASMFAHLVYGQLYLWDKTGNPLGTEHDEEEGRCVPHVSDDQEDIALETIANLQQSVFKALSEEKLEHESVLSESLGPDDEQDLLNFESLHKSYMFRRRPNTLASKSAIESSDDKISREVTITLNKRKL
jgi:hypothetical protein